jgi:raffinose/stachyose/melibiose transport system substrate-binding protein
MKRFIAIALSMLILLTLAACAPKSEATEPIEEKSVDTPKEAEETIDQDVTITYMASQDWVQDAEIELGEKFTEETGIKVDFQIVPADQYFNLLMTKLNANEGPDLFGSQSGASDIQTQLNVVENAVDLSGEEWASIVDPLAAQQLSVDGKLYGQPISDLSSVWAIAYNKNVFTDLGLEIPTTFDEFMTVCESINAAGITPIYECIADGWHHVLWFPEMGPAYEKAEPGLAAKLNNNEDTFAGNETMKTAIEQILEMVELGYWGSNYMSNEYANAAASIADGSYAMFVANQGFGVEVNTADPEFAIEDIGYFVMPILDNQTLNMNPAGPSRFIYSKGENIDYAKQYLAFLAQTENIQYLIDNSPRNNTLPFTTAQDVYNDSIKEFYARYDEQGTVYQVAVNYLNPQWMELGKDLTSIFIGDMTPDDMLEMIDTRRTEQAAAVKDTAWSK